MAAYFRSNKGPIVDQPSSNDSGVTSVESKKYVVLRNARGVLAVYRVRNDGMLKGLKRWPAELEKF
jgi:hypothetical protein